MDMDMDKYHQYFRIYIKFTSHIYILYILYLYSFILYKNFIKFHLEIVHFLFINNFELKWFPFPVENGNIHSYGSQKKNWFNEHLFIYLFIDIFSFFLFFVSFIFLCLISLPNAIWWNFSSVFLRMMEWMCVCCCWYYCFN